jgi:hypothetical protein
VNLDRFGLLQDAELGLFRAAHTDAFLERAPAASKGTRSWRAEVLERSFGAPTPAKKKKKKTATAAKPTKKKPSKPSKKTKTKAKKPAEKAKGKAKGKAKEAKATSKQEQHEKLKKQFELVDFTEDITQMSLDTLRRHFGYASGSIDKGLFVNNVIWQVYNMFKVGKAPPFVANGGSVRSFWYHVKKVVQDHPRAFKVPKDLDGLFSKQLSAMVRAGLLSYKDLKITDDRQSFRKLAPVYGNPHIILLGEKFSFLSKLIDLHLQYGITIQCSKGMPSLVMADTMLTEMAEKRYDMSQEFIILTFTDFDPTGWNIGNTFARHLKELGVKNIRRFSQYPTPRDCLDVVCPHDLPADFLERSRLVMKKKLQRAALTRKWALATGGLYKRGGINYAVSAEEHLGFLDAMLAEKIAPFLVQPPEVFTRMINFEYLSEMMGKYLLERLLTAPEPIP